MVTRSGAVRLIECCPARSTIACSAAKRSVVETNRSSRVWRAASARRFQRVQVARLVCSVRTVAAPYASSVSGSGLRPPRDAGRWRQGSLDRGDGLMSDRLASAFAPLRHQYGERLSEVLGWSTHQGCLLPQAYISRRPGGWIWSIRSSRSALRLASICADLAENSRISSSGIASISNAGFRREPRSHSGDRRRAQPPAATKESGG